MITIAQPRFCEVNPAELLSVGRYRGTERQVQLRSDAVAAIGRMFAEARAAAVRLVPISGFRSIEYQAGLFTKAVAKYGSEAVAGGWVARPGYSEHHTGFAIDLGAEAFPDYDCATAFEETAEFRWLCENAARFGFELSFPRNNNRGINYEPWHWRFVGTDAAKEVFGQ